MVHALTEVRRLLKPGGYLIDVRPSPRHRKVGYEQKGRFTHVDFMRESLEETRLANRAVNTVLGRKLYKQAWRVEVECRRSIDTLTDLQDWFDNYAIVAELPPHEWLTEKVGRAMQGVKGRKKIIITGPLTIRVLRKPGG